MRDKSRIGSVFDLANIFELIAQALAIVLRHLETIAAIVTLAELANKYGSRVFAYISLRSKIRYASRFILNVTVTTAIWFIAMVAWPFWVLYRLFHIVMCRIVEILFPELVDADSVKAIRAMYVVNNTIILVDDY